MPDDHAPRSSQLPPVRRWPLLLPVALMACALLAATPWLDRHADTALGSAIASTLVLFASVRGVDAVISAAAGTELSLTPAGVGVTMAPGELLDPLNDLVEQLGELLVWALTLLGLEKLGLGLIATPWVRALTALPLAGAAVLCWWRPPLTWPRGVRRTLLLLILIRVLLPLSAIGSELIAQHIMASRAASAESALVELSQQIDAGQQQSQAAATPTPDDASLLDRLGGAMQRAGDALDVQSRFQQLASRLEAGVTHLVDLLALVTLRAVLFPVLFLLACWVLWRLADD